MASVLASYQCGPGSIPGPGVICGLSLWLVPSLLRRRGFSPGTTVFPTNQHFQISVQTEHRGRGGGVKFHGSPLLSES